MKGWLELGTSFYGASFYADSDSENGFRSGEIFHLEKNQQGGSVSTPLARYFVTKPQIGAEGFHPHWRVDCFVRQQKLAPAEAWLAKRPVKALRRSALIEEPIWLSWHRSAETGGKADLLSVLEVAAPNCISAAHFFCIS